MKSIKGLIKIIQSENNKKKSEIKKPNIKINLLHNSLGIYW